MATVTAIESKENALTLSLDLGDAGKDLEQGASVAVSGVCLTTSYLLPPTSCRFDVMGETLAKTSLGSLRVGDRVNVERSARIGDEIGGHLVSGHVTGTVAIREIDTLNNNYIVMFACDASWMPYILPKGFIALDGCSLTIVDVSDATFTIHLIPETLQRTTFGQKKVGDQINLEIDSMTRAIVDTVARITQV